MNFNIIAKENGRYLDCTSFTGVLSSEKDAIDLVSACFSNDTGSLLLHERSVSPDFFNLRTGLAGAVLNKFQTYNIKTALIIQDMELLEGRFGEMVMESNKGNEFRVYDSVQAAEEWILSAAHESVMRLG
ncbi:MAG: DUF4180 domain-containing protein [Lachnospiraceae bacterium]|nr:DUF4180 domain-containing protein [Lachnospiraceae bacterium]